MNKNISLSSWINKIKVVRTMHVIVLVLCIFLITLISLEIFNELPRMTQKIYMRIQLWICIIFILDFFVEQALSERKWHYLKKNFIFLLVSIPYTNLFQFTNIVFTPEAEYLIKLAPLIRGGYALAIIVSWLSYNSAKSLLITYLTILLSTIYFSTLIFYSVEVKVNPAVQNYGDSLWWAFMNVTTVGSNIFPVTTVGKILSILIAAMGMMMFPIFTVYITNRITLIDKRKKEEMTELFGSKEKAEQAEALLSGDKKDISQSQHSSSEPTDNS